MRRVQAVAAMEVYTGGGDTSTETKPQLGSLLQDSIESCKWHCKALDLRRASVRLGGLLAYLNSGRLTFRRMDDQINEFVDDIGYEFNSRRFALISPAKEALYGFFVKNWHTIIEAFPDSGSDCKDATTCYAFDLYTAGVFHAMRISEHGLRELASRIDVKLIDKREEIAVEFADWQKIIASIRSTIAAIRSQPKGQKREADLTFYSEMADHCEYMKDYWRNPTAHCRRRYNEVECGVAIERVRGFMLLLVKGMEARK